MRSARLLPSALMLALLPAALAQSAVSGPHERSEPATAVMLAESTSAHTYSGNQDVYVATVTRAGKHEPQLAKLVDRYPGYGYKIDRAALESSRTLRVRITRDRSCDTRAEEIFLPTSKDRDFDPDLRQTLDEHKGEVVECYLLQHDLTRVTR